MTEVKTEEKKVGLLGATSLVGQCLLPLLKQSGWQIKAFSRRPPETACPSTEWIQLKQPVCQNDFIDDPTEKITHWICVASIWVLPDYFHMLERYGAKKDNRCFFHQSLYQERLCRRGRKNDGAKIV